jgi:diaminopimelate epimerase
VDELIEQPIEIGKRKLRFTGVSLGNPHCVLFRPRGEDWSVDELRELGPALAKHEIFPKGVNVQLAVPKGPRELFLRIWERGAGETTASGSSACAAAAAAVRLGLVKSPVTVASPGGELEVAVDPSYRLTLRGPVEEVARGRLSPSFLRTLR